ncbi:MAG: shikimate dehydrogenase [Deltaproteobacteria bacterium]|nr:shikimate dehydrogenase [Deltaproteobacteria bacterium]
MKITGETKVIGIFGYPVSHTLSPLMQNAALEALGLNYIYVPFEVRPESLEFAVNGIRALGVSGVNVTVPYKESVMKFLDEIDESAGLIGAVNTILNKNGRLKGYNTDSPGYIRSLHEDAGFDPKGKTILVVGAGGGARGIIAGLLLNGTSEIVIANRTIEKAEEIKVNYAKICRRKHIQIKTAPLSYLNDPQILSSVDLIVNTTSMGLEGGFPDVDFSLTSRNVLISDIAYKPPLTQFLKKAQGAGRKISGGLGMLVYQGAISLEIWTGRKAPVEVMKNSLKIFLNE